MTDARDLDALTTRFGREVFARLDRPGPVPFTPAWIDERLMEASMGDEYLKLQLFRFIDVLPMLRGRPPAVVGHLREYLREAEDRLPAGLAFAARRLPRHGPLASLVSWTARRSASRLARKFIAGSNLPEVIDAVGRMRRGGFAFTVDLLGEATVTEKEADQHQAEYLHLIEGLSRSVHDFPEQELIDADEDGTPLPRVNVSVKLTALYSQFDPIDPEGTSRAVLARLRPLLRAAREHGAFVNIDMEQYAFKDLTLRIFREALEEDEFHDWPDVGLALQAYLRDCEEDVQQLAGWARRRGTPVWVRLVKGAYWDYETILAAQQGWPSPVWDRKEETDANYERLSRFLLENRRVLRPAFGSHNVRSLAHVMALAHSLGLPPRSYEIQMLYGMADPIKDALAEMGRRVRVYTPYGELLPGMAYLVRRLLENTANESFLRANFTENVPEEQLLMNPQRIADSGLRIADSQHHTHGGNPQSQIPNPQFQVEPLSDFSKEEPRRRMREALEEVKDKLGAKYPLVIGGEEVQTAEWVPSVNPCRKREVVGHWAKATPDHARRAIEAAHNAFPAWRDTPAKERAEYLFRAAEIMRRRRFELAAWQVYECAKQWREADADVAEAIDYCDFYAHEMLRLDRPRLRNVPGEDNSYFYEPRGVAVVIAPWNFPLAILTGMTTAALVTGNTAIMKPAEQSSVMGAKLMEVFREAEFPPGVVHYLPGQGEEVGPVLAGHPDVAMIAFTGSLGVGKVLNRQAAELAPGQEQFKRIIAEMGGKNALIIDDDADLDEAVEGTAASAFGYSGQKCSACSRVIVPEHLHDAFVDRLVEATRSLAIGPADDPGSFVGAVINEEAYDRIRATIEKAKAEGEGRLRYAGEVGTLADEGYFIAPHIFTDVDPRSELAQEEIFGPVLAVLRCRDLTHALEIANGTRYALTGGLYSRSPGNIGRVKREFRVGNLYINRKITGALVDRQPFGGYKLSGLGTKAGGPDYLLQFLVPRTITENTLRRGFAPEAQKGGI